MPASDNGIAGRVAERSKPLPQHPHHHCHLSGPKPAIYEASSRSNAVCKLTSNQLGQDGSPWTMTMTKKKARLRNSEGTYLMFDDARITMHMTCRIWYYSCVPFAHHAQAEVVVPWGVWMSKRQLRSGTTPMAEGTRVMRKEEHKPQYIDQGRRTTAQ